MNLTEFSKQVHKANVDKGFYEEHEQVVNSIQNGFNSTEPNTLKSYLAAFIDQRIALVHSEISEALEANRKDNRAGCIHTVNEFLDDSLFKAYFEGAIKDSLEDELADTLIRILDLSGYLEIDLAAHVESKLRYNSLRPVRHGKNY